MKKSLIASAVLALGVSAALPMTASADWRDRRDDDRRYERRDDYRYDRRDDYRHDHRDYDRHCNDDFDREISLRDVPRNVLESVNCETRGRGRIEAVQFVHRNGNFFYRFRMDDPRPRDNDVNIRVSPGGKIMGVEEARRCDDGYFARR
jgi:hypothetical protein